LNAAGLSARLGAAVGPWFDPSSGDLELTAEAARLGDALRDLGLGSAAGATGLDRPLRLAARLRRAGDSYALSLDGEALPSRVEARLDLRLGEGSAAVTGTVDGSTVDHDLLAAALGMSRLAPDAGAGSWLGRLPPLPLSLDRFRGLDLDVSCARRACWASAPARAGRRRRASASTGTT
jgi:hypothetical protein